MKQPLYFTKLFLLLFIAAWTGSCGLPEDPSKISLPEWQPEIAVPLINSDIQLNEILGQFDSLSYLQIDDQGLLSVVYAADLFTVPPTSIIPLPRIPVPMFDSVVSIASPMSNVQRISLRSGQLAYDFEGTHVGPTEVTIRLFNAVREGQIFEETISFVSPGLAEGTLDLSGYDLEFTSGTLDLAYSATNTLDDSKLVLNRAIISLTGMEYSYVEGYMGQYGFDLAQDSLEVAVSTGWEDIDFQITDPRIRFSVSNSYGIPIEVRTPKLGVIQADGSYLSVASEALTEGITLNHPRLNEVGSSAQTTFELNKDNSALPQAIHPLPEALVYQLGAQAHPNGDSTEIGFITDSSTFSVGIEVEVPLEFTLSPYSVQDTFSLDLSAAEVLEAASVIMITENGFPIELEVQAYFLSENDEVTDSLFASSTTILAGAPVDASGRVISSADERLEVTLGPDLVDAILGAKSIIVKATIGTSQAGSVPVRIYEDYGLGLKMGLRANVNVR
ncbi:MAG: hypothetical protein AAF731_17550 [Bacteroidota bacterium]